ncbi:MAG: Kazal-type serine protease inhibitor domain-containing protein [Nannocystaceae bacterium]
MRRWICGVLFGLIGFAIGACDAQDRPGASADLRTGEECESSKACGEDEFCAVPEGECGVRGVCEVRPVSCERDRPVCGCDGYTYESECVAWMNGVSVDFHDVCPPPGCQSNAECGAGSYCAKMTGDCGGYGACTATPATCSAAYVPVCGCNGLTYTNACKAAKARVSIAHNGQC